MVLEKTLKSPLNSKETKPVNPKGNQPWIFPDSSAGKEFACNAGDLGLIPGSGRSTGGWIGYPLQSSGLENSMHCIIHVVTKSRTRLSDFTFTFHFQFCKTKVIILFLKSFSVTAVSFLVELLLEEGSHPCPRHGVQGLFTTHIPRQQGGKKPWSLFL